MTPSKPSGKLHQHLRRHQARPTGHWQSITPLCPINSRSNFHHRENILGTFSDVIFCRTSLNPPNSPCEKPITIYVFEAFSADDTAFNSARAASSVHVSKTTHSFGAPLARPSNSAISNSSSAVRDTTTLSNSTGVNGEFTHQTYDPIPSQQGVAAYLGVRGLNRFDQFRVDA